MADFKYEPNMIEGIDYIVCQLCGKKCRAIGNHLRQKHPNVTKKQYRDMIGATYTQSISCKKTYSRLSESVLKTIECRKNNNTYIPPKAINNHIHKISTAAHKIFLKNLKIANKINKEITENNKESWLNLVKEYQESKFKKFINFCKSKGYDEKKYRLILTRLSYHKIKLNDDNI